MGCGRSGGWRRNIWASFPAEGFVLGEDGEEEVRRTLEVEAEGGGRGPVRQRELSPSSP